MTKAKLIASLHVAAIATLLLSGAAYGVDSPHSRQSLGSIFSEQGFAGGAQQPAAPKELTIGKIVDLLDEAGQEPEIVGDSATVKLQHAKWTFAVAMKLSPERDQVLVHLTVLDLEGKPALAPERLTALLGANLQLRPAFFAVGDKGQKIELVLSIAGEQVTAESLREGMSRLATIAESTASLWEIGGSEPQAATATTPGNTTISAQPPKNAALPRNVAVPPQNAAPAGANLVGTWSAEKGKGVAFAMLLKADGSFVLVYVNGAKKDRSVGKFTFNGGQLILTTSDGGKFQGGIRNVTGKSFEFIPQSGKSPKLTFVKAS